MEAKVLYWNDQKKFGFVETKSGEELFLGAAQLYGPMEFPLKPGTILNVTSIFTPRRTGERRCARGVTLD